ncbi:hypothetical protein ACHWQZ_G000112 [Mnemiopsis leidyi]
MHILQIYRESSPKQSLLNVTVVVLIVSLQCLTLYSDHVLGLIKSIPLDQQLSSDAQRTVAIRFFMRSTQVEYTARLPVGLTYKVTELITTRERERESDVKVLGIYFSAGELTSVQNCQNLSVLLYSVMSLTIVISIIFWSAWFMVGQSKKIFKRAILLAIVANSLTCSTVVVIWTYCTILPCFFDFLALEGGVLFEVNPGYTSQFIASQFLHTLLSISLCWIESCSQNDCVVVADTSFIDKFPTDCKGVRRIEKGFLLLEGLKNAGISFCGTSQLSKTGNAARKHTTIAPLSTESFDGDGASLVLNRADNKRYCVCIDKEKLEIAEQFLKLELMMLKL